MATALPGDIDDRDGSPTRLGTSAQCVHTSLRTSQDFGLLSRKSRDATEPCQDSVASPTRIGGTQTGT